MKLTVKRQESKPEPPPIKSFILEFTPEEAVWIKTICSNIGGSCKQRNFFTNLGFELSENGIREDQGLLASKDENIYFKNNTCKDENTKSIS